MKPTKSTQTKGAAARSKQSAPRSAAPPAAEAIAALAYEYYCERGRTEGDDLSDWLRAEAELKARSAGAGEEPA